MAIPEGITPDSCHSRRNNGVFTAEHQCITFCPVAVTDDCIATATVRRVAFFYLDKFHIRAARECKYTQIGYIFGDNGSLDIIAIKFSIQVPHAIIAAELTRTINRESTIAIVHRPVDIRFPSAFFDVRHIVNNVIVRPATYV